jgi:hypothetical protein
VQLIEDAEHKEKYASKMSSLKHDLQVLLGKSSCKDRATGQACDKIKNPSAGFLSVV